MAGAGGHEVERIAVKVVPDTGGFKKKLKKFLERIEKESKVEVPVELKGLSKAKTELEALAKNITVKVKLELENLATVRSQLAALTNPRDINLNVDVDTTFAKAKLAEISRHLNVKVELDLDQAVIELATFLRPRTLTVHVEVDRDEFNLLRGELRRLQRMTSNMASNMNIVGNRASQAFSQATNSVSQFSGGIRSLARLAFPLLAAAVLVAIGAIAGLVIILGAVVGGLALMLPPIAAIGAGVAYILQSNDEQAKRIRKQFDGVKEAAKDTLSSAIRPMTAALRQQIPIVEKWIRNLKGPLTEAFTAGSGYVDEFSAGLRGLVDNALKGLVEALQNPEMSAAVDGFKQFLLDIGTAIGEFFKTLAGGGSDYRDMFEALGDALIELAPSLGRLLNAFATVSPDVIDSLAGALTRIFDTLSSNGSVLEKIATLAEFSFQALSWAFIAITSYIGSLVWQYETLWNSTKWVIEGIGDLWNWFVDWITGLWDSLKSGTISRLQSMNSSVSSSFSGMAASITGTLDSLLGWIADIWSSITGTSSSGANNTKNASVGPFNGMLGAISGIMNSIVGIVESAWSRISGIVSNIAGAVGRARSLVNGLSGIASNLNPFSLFSAPVENAPMPLFKSPDGDDAMAPMALSARSIYDSVDQMAETSRNLRRTYLNARGREAYDNPAQGQGNDLAQRIFNFTTYAAPNEPTERQFVKWMDYADTLYAT
ncbi:hypothetical protein [Actinomadura sp. WMMB 499]|uniref:phage tail protein n=1 Tax=Actinomadura sp. WMMB 499 TaxID=1219491 RepID=UPI001243BCB2|nr:hypothetical protein [Actinomadura sp. WMMB 499]QFG25445.1 hypothetical protein F7P10_34075 [Actinomadura sp. WMMB 499]